MQQTGLACPQFFLAERNLYIPSLGACLLFGHVAARLWSRWPRVLPWALEARRRQESNRLRFWSAGCSSGEEPYSMAMCVLDAVSAASGPRGWDVRIFATDINRDVLKAAAENAYCDWALRHMPADKKGRYMVPLEGGRHRVSEQVAAAVAFEQKNLLESGPAGDPRDLDAIFCRNVLIYFDDEDVAKVVQRFYDSLRPGGWLFLGHSESLHHITGAFEVVLEPGVVVYRKGEE